MARRCWCAQVPFLLALGLIHGAAWGAPRAQGEAAGETIATGRGAAPAEGLPKHVTNGIGMDLVLVRPGYFSMGTDPKTLRTIRQMRPRWRVEMILHECPRHRVRISQPFYIGRYEVTNAEFRRFRPQHDSQHFLGRSLDHDRQPVVLVSWRDAVAFCQWLSKRDGRHYTLPTEAEWEYACRGGTDTIFYWGDAFDASLANHGDRHSHYPWSRTLAADKHAVSAPVGSYPANRLGLHDMLGNVWEWCADWYDASYYRHSPRDDPPGARSGVLRVCRGGSWDVFPADNRCGKRAYYFPSDRYMALGFRVVMRPNGRGHGSR